MGGLAKSGHTKGNYFLCQLDTNYGRVWKTVSVLGFYLEDVWVFFKERNTNVEVKICYGSGVGSTPTINSCVWD